MKQLTCNDLGGACNAMIQGNTLEEMGENSNKHVLALKAEGDTSHDAAMAKMQGMSLEEIQAFWADCTRKFEEADEM